MPGPPVPYGMACLYGKPEAEPALACRKRVMGIEPTYPAWKAGVLPLNYTRVISDTIGILSYNFIKCKNFFKFFS